MMEPKSHKSFNGTFDSSIRQELREKRRFVGVSLEQLGEFLKINWTTIRKWEAGVTTTCHPRHISRIISFLDGEFDEEIRRKYDLNIVTMWDHSSHVHLLNKLTRSFSSDLKNLLIPEFEKAFFEVIKKYLDQIQHYDDKK
jgi:hypothetical protein